MTTDVTTKPAGVLPRRAYGDTGVQLSIVGFGGIAVASMVQNEANRLVAESFERGVNYFDVAPTYGDAEVQLGPALEPYRKDIFLACKTTKRDRAAAEEEFNASLERLRTDHFDLYQLHALTSVEKDVEAAFAPGGVMEMLLEKQKEGRVRFIGFSAHSGAAAVEALNRHDFDSVLFPFNFVTWHNDGFGREVMELAQQKGAARLALKGMAKQKWQEGDARKDQYRKCWYEPAIDPELAALALRWTLSQPVTAAVSPGEPAMLRLALDIVANGVSPIQPAETERLQAMVSDLEPIFTKA